MLPDAARLWALRWQKRWQQTGPLHKGKIMNDATTLSVREAVAFVDEHYRYPNESHLVSERHTRRLLSDGRWPCTRTSSGHVGITVADLQALWTPAPR